MSTYLICSTPAHGHVVPLLGIARHLVEQGHRVRFVTSERYGDRVRESGAEFLALPAGGDVNLEVHDAGLNGRFGPGRLDRFREAGQPVAADDEHFLDASVASSAQTAAQNFAPSVA